MELEHEFTVPVGVADAWDVLLDVERIAPCMPGATVLDVRGDDFAGTVKVKVGPISMTYAGDARFAEKDEAARRVVMEAAGKESRGSGTAKATVTATLAEGSDGSSTDVKVHTDLTVTGRPAQFGRGMLQDVGGRLIGQFADNLAEVLRSGDGSGGAASAEAETSGRSDAGGSGGGGAPSTGAMSTGTTTRGASGGSAGSAAATGSRPPRPAGSSDAIDLLQVTGVSGVVSRYKVPILSGAAAGAVLLFLLVRKRRRAH